IAPFVTEVERVLSDYLSQIEIVFVDDGSSDNTAQKAIELQQDKSFINLLQLSRNFGKEAAVSAALDTVEAAAYVIIDVDLQHPLSTVIEFIHIWQTEKIDNIYGIRNEKYISSLWFYRLFNRLSGRVKIPVNVSDFRLIDRKVVEILRTLPERNRFMKGLFAWGGLKSRGVPYIQAERKTGNTKFNYPKLWNFALDGIMGFSTLPLRVWSYFGGFVALLAFIYMLWIVAKTLIFGIDVSGYASLMSVTLFLGGIQLVSIGILGEYLGRVSEEVKRRPVYVIADIVGDMATNNGKNGCGVILEKNKNDD
ncbi:MAG: glycosyltransferase family 2 protein, partial [Neisseriaceae bacterium]|nr:glycosyltransferase family 2 protein [Neisseriaceae bacterium]